MPLNILTATWDQAMRASTLNSPPRSSTISSTPTSTPTPSAHSLCIRAWCLLFCTILYGLCCVDVTVEVLFVSIAYSSLWLDCTIDLNVGEEERKEVRWKMIREIPAMSSFASYPAKYAMIWKKDGWGRKVTGWKQLGYKRGNSKGANYD